MTGVHAERLAAGGWPAESVGTSIEWALAVAAAGAHPIAITCPPDAGKNLVMPWLASILPDLDDQAAWEVAALHSLAGAPRGWPPPRRPPVQAPDHRISVADLIGTGLARPGVLSLAHRGVLLMDHAHRFSPRVWQALHQPLAHGVVRLRRAGLVADLSARVQLVLTAPRCPPRLDESLWDRIEIRAHLDPHTADQPSIIVANRVATACAAAATRWATYGWRSNAELPRTLLRSPPWRLPARVLAPIDQQVATGQLSAHGYDQVLRIAWTIADLTGHPHPNENHVYEASRLHSAPVDTVG